MLPLRMVETLTKLVSRTTLAAPFSFSFFFFFFAQDSSNECLQVAMLAVGAVVAPGDCVAGRHARSAAAGAVANKLGGCCGSSGGC